MFPRAISSGLLCVVVSLWVLRNGQLHASGETFAQWQARYFTGAALNNPATSGPAADPDHDGMSNLQEFTAGTDPTSAESVLKIDRIDWSGKIGLPLKLTFKSIPNKTYTILCQD